MEKFWLFDLSLFACSFGVSDGFMLKLQSCAAGGDVNSAKFLEGISVAGKADSMMVVRG